MKIPYSEAIKFKNQTDWLNFYYIHFGNFWVQKQWIDKDNNPFFSKWWEYSPGSNSKANARLIFPIEIVIDIDCKSKERAKLVSENIKNKLKNKKINFSLWDSGGVGYHFHLFYPELKNFSLQEREFIKREFLKWIEIDKGYVDLTTVYKKRLISLECSKHRKGGSKKLIEYIDCFGVNELPKQVIEKALSELSKEENFKTNPEIVEFSKSDMKCIQFIEEGNIPNTIKDFYRRAAFIYATYMVHKHTKEFILKRLMKHLNMSEQTAKLIVKYVNKGRVMSCRGRRNLLRDVGLLHLCDGCKVKINNKD